MNSDIKYYLAIFIRRLPIFMVISAAMMAGAVALAILLPTVYTSSARLLVETAQIPDQLAETTVQVSGQEQLQVIEQRLITRNNLIDIARKFDVFEDLSDMSPDQIVRQMRANTSIKSSGGRDRATLMTIQFNARAPRIASSVVNEYVTRILDENVRIRIRQSGGTLDFFEQEVARLSAELDLRSARILEFQNANSDALPDSLEFRLTKQSSLQERLQQMSRDRSSLQDQRARLIQIFEATGQLATGPSQRRTPEEVQLAQAKEELNAARTIFSDNNQKVKLLQARVAQLQSVVNSQAAGQDIPTDSASILDIQLAEIDARTASLDEQSKRAEAELATLEDSISRTPANAIALESYQREYQNIQIQYNQAIDRQAKAATGVTIERQQMGQSIKVIEQATTPTEPTSPNRPLIAMGGSGLGVVAAAGVIVLLEVLNSSIRRPMQLTNSLGITPLATIPFIQTRGQVTRRRLILLLIFTIIAFGVPAILYLIHVSYLPLDLIWDRFLDRLGL